jgi:hypothetical protein
VTIRTFFANSTDEFGVECRRIEDAGGPNEALAARLQRLITPIVTEEIAAAIKGGMETMTVLTIVSGTLSTIAASQGARLATAGDEIKLVALLLPDAVNSYVFAATQMEVMKAQLIAAQNEAPETKN